MNAPSADVGKGLPVKAVITLFEETVAPRFDLCVELLIVEIHDDGTPGEEKHMVLPRPSAEHVCRLALEEGADVIICGGIEEEYYEYLTWKKIAVFDSVIGSKNRVVRLLAQGRLKAGTILREEG